MDTETSTIPDLYLVVGYDGSPPSARALDAAVGLLHGRAGRIDVMYVAHLSSLDTLSADAVAETEATFGDIAKELNTSAGERLRGREDRWRFEWQQGVISEVLVEAATRLHDEHPGDNVAIVVGSSSQAMHRIIGSVAVSLARRAPVPVVIVP